MVPVDDSELYMTDTGGAQTPLVYLNGAYADQTHWRRVITELGGAYRHITYDQRARGKSKKSTDYSFETCIRDLDAILAAWDVTRPILVGWSYGAILAWRWADRDPRCTLRLVSVDAFPIGLTDPAGQARIRELFGRMRLFLPLARPFGLAAQMTADQHAEVNIEINQISAASAPVLERLSCPVRFVLASGANFGTKPGEMDEGRATLDPIFARNPNLIISAKVASNHGNILRRDFRAIADAVRELSAPHPN